MEPSVSPEPAVPHPGEAGRRGIRDLLAVATGTVVCAALAMHFEWSEKLFAWTRNAEAFQLDELAFALLTLAVGLAWFAARRSSEAREELLARLRAQALLAEALANQRALAQQAISLQEGERKRLARELHDELGQFVQAIKLDAVAIRDADHGTALVERARSILTSANHVQDSVARLIRELRPVGLDELGLTAAIEHCAQGWRNRLAPTRLSLQLDERVDQLDEATGLTLYRTVQEALTNCARHARASRVNLALSWREEPGDLRPEVLVQVEDDGVGVDLAAAGPGLGLVGMRERLTALGGSLTLETQPGAGFRLLARVPVATTPATTSVSHA
jgi:signal transduction histidine kinase